MLRRCWTRWRRRTRASGYEHLPSRVGPGEGRNLALDMANGDYVWFVRTTDLVPPGALSAGLERLDEVRPDVLLVQHARAGTAGERRPGPHLELLASIAETGPVTLDQRPELVQRRAQPVEQALPPRVPAHAGRALRPRHPRRAGHDLARALGRGADRRHAGRELHPPYAAERDPGRARGRIADSTSSRSTSRSSHSSTPAPACRAHAPSWWRRRCCGMRSR